MKIGSLFSGIGGIELGLEWSGIGATVWQVEQDEYCRAVLAKHWPNVKRFTDVRSVGSDSLASVDLVCGGFPCQDISSAGKRAGLAGARSGLWFEYLRIVGELRPQWVVVENVASGARAWVDTVCAGLGEQNYACLPIPLAAADVGAPHERKRVFIVAANTDAKSQHAGAEHAEVAGAPIAADTQQNCIRFESGRRGRSNRCHTSELTDHGDALCARCQGASAVGHEGLPKPAEGSWGTPMPNLLRVADGLSRGMDSPRKRIAALGNAVVPQCAEVVGYVIRELAAFSVG